MKERYTIEYEVGDLLFEFSPTAGFKGDLTVVADDQPLTLKIDINSPVGRSKLIAEAYELYPEVFALSEIEFRRALNDLATHIDEEFKLRSAKDEEEESDLAGEDADVDEDEAEALINAPNVLDRYVETMAHIFDVDGDRAQMKVVALGALSAQLESLSSGVPLGTNVMLIGEAGRGKNFVSDAVAAGMPRAFVYEFESASSKSFYYAADAQPDRFRHTWIYPNEAEATDMLVEILRPLLSKAKATHGTVDTGEDGSNVFRELTVEGPLTATIPTVRNKLDNQLQSRLLVIELEEFEGRVPRHSAKVSESLLLNRALEDHAGELALWRAALKMLTEVRRVGIVTHHEMFKLDTNKISHGARLWRNFLSLMLTHAWLEQRNREAIELKKGEEAVVVAAEDYRAAYEIFSTACKRSVVELSDTHRAILNALHKLDKASKGSRLQGGGFSYRKVGEAAGLSHETVRKQKTFLYSLGLLRNPEEGGMRLVKDADSSWWEDQASLEGFPSPDQVEAWWEKEKKDEGVPKGVDTVDTSEKEDEKPIGMPNTDPSEGVGNWVDVSTLAPEANGSGGISAPIDESNEESGDPNDYEYS